MLRDDLRRAKHGGKSYAASSATSSAKYTAPFAPHRTSFLPLDKHRSINAAVSRRENSPPDCFLILLTFFKTIKAEMLWQRSWRTRRDAEMAIFEYINGVYNPRRRHAAPGWKSPLAFEAKAAKVSNPSAAKA